MSTKAKAKAILSRVELLKEASNNFKAKQKEIEEKISLYNQDIKDLITLARELEEAGFSLTTHKVNFITNSETQGIGFCTSTEYRLNKPITFIGINSTGTYSKLYYRNCGEYSTGGLFDNTGFPNLSMQKTPIELLYKFHEEFPKFKENFLNYVDCIIKENSINKQ